MPAGATAVLKEFREDIEFGAPFKEAHIDGLVIHNVKLLGAVSKNNRIYSSRALADAVRLYDGVRIMVDHPTDEEQFEHRGVRPFDVLIGKAMNTRQSGDEVRGDIQLLEGEPRTPKVISLARDMPNLAGFSHRARGTVTVDNDGVEHVESLEQVFAVELVTEPATTNGIFESVKKPATPVEENEMKIEDLTVAQLQAARPDLLKSITEAVTEGMRSAEVVTTLEARGKELEKELAESKKHADELEAAGKLRDHKTMVATKLSAAGLHESVVTDLFKENLDAAKDEAAVDALIADRKAMAEKIEGGLIEAGEELEGAPKSDARSVDEALKKKGDSKIKPVTAEVVMEAATKLF